MLLKNGLLLLLMTLLLLHDQYQVDASLFAEPQVFTPLITDADQNFLELMNQESLGQLKIEMKAKDVISILGNPEGKGGKQLWGSDGLYHQNWSYTSRGIFLDIASEKSDESALIFSIKVTSPARLKTKRGIGIGDTYEKVREIYRQYEDKENSMPGKTFVAGSIYGGIIFTFKNNRVEQIYLGSVAE